MTEPKKNLKEIAELAQRFVRLVAEDEPGHATWHQAVAQLGCELNYATLPFIRDTDSRLQRLFVVEILTGSRKELLECLEQIMQDIREGVPEWCAAPDENRGHCTHPQISEIDNVPYPGTLDFAWSLRQTLKELP